VRQVIAPVISNHNITPDCYLMWLDSPEIAVEATPGQFVMIRCGEEDTLLRRPLSIHRIDLATGRLALLFQVVGKGTDWLARRKVGDTVDIFGPLGNGFTLPNARQHILLVAGGIGITPLYFLAQEAKNHGHSVTLLYGTANNKRYPISLDIKAVAATEDGTVGHQGMITDLLPDYTNWADQISACGPTRMYRDMILKKKEFGLEGKPVQISLEMRMGCGLGVCYACTVRTKQGLKQVCKDGPVFDLNDIYWEGINL